MVNRDQPFVEPGKRFPPRARTPKKKDARRTEEYWYFAEDWNLSPVQTSGGGRNETSEIVSVSAASTWADYFAGAVHDLMTKSDVDGFYFDLASPRINYDTARGYAYHTADGRLEGTIEVFAARALYKRLYAMFGRHRLIQVHLERHLGSGTLGHRLGALDGNPVLVRTVVIDRAEIVRAACREGVYGSV